MGLDVGHEGDGSSPDVSVIDWTANPIFSPSTDRWLAVVIIGGSLLPVITWVWVIFRVGLAATLGSPVTLLIGFHVAMLVIAGRAVARVAVDGPVSFDVALRAILVPYAIAAAAQVAFQRATRHVR